MAILRIASDTAPVRNQWLRIWLMVGYIAVWSALWFVSGQLNLIADIRLWYPPAGLTFAILLACGAWALPLPVLSSLLVGFSIWSWTQWPYHLAVSLLPPLTYLAVTYPLRRCASANGLQSWSFRSARQVAVFLGATAVAALLAALIGATLLKAAGTLPDAFSLRDIVLNWWVGDFIGIVTFAPLLIIFVAPLIRCLGKGQLPRPLQWSTLVVKPSSIRLALFQIALSALLLVTVFWVPPHLWGGRSDPFMALLVLPVLVWVVATRGIREAVLAVLLFELGIVVMVIAFGQAELTFQYQIVMAAIAASGLLTGAIAHEKLTSAVMFRDLTQISNDLLWEFDADGHLREIKGPFAKIAQPAGDSRQVNWLSFVISQEPDPNVVALKTAIQYRQPFRQLVLRMQWPGQDRPVWARNCGLPLFDEFGEFVGYRGTTTDITTQKNTEDLQRKAEALLRNYDQTLEAKIAAKVEERTRALAEASLRNWKLANFDNLTSLPNRNLLFEHLRKGLEQARRDQRLLAVLLVDLDGFKQVNDTFGHDAGDELLRQIADRLRSSVRAADTPARMGGDEFTVVLPGLSNPEVAAVVAQKIVVGLAQPVSLNSGSATVTASIGIAIYRPEQPANLEMAMTLLRQADAAMYAAKRAGKNNWRFAEEAGIQ